VYADNIDNVVDRFIEAEQPNTSFNLHQRVVPMYSNDDATAYHDIVVTINGHYFNNSDYHYLEKLSEIIKDTNEIGIFEIGNMRIEIISLIEHQNELICLDKIS
jgi:hypothetical protein